MFRYLMLALTFLTLAYPTYASQPSFEEQHTLIPAPRAVTMDADADCTSKMAYTCAKIGYCCDYKQPFCNSEGILTSRQTGQGCMVGGWGCIGSAVTFELGTCGKLCGINVATNLAMYTGCQWASLGLFLCGCVVCTTSASLGGRKHCYREELCCPTWGECLPGSITKNCCPIYSKEYERYYSELKRMHGKDRISMEG